MTLPLLIGGATTSPQHTAVKIAPEYAAADRARARRVARRRRGRRACSSDGQRAGVRRGEPRRRRRSCASSTRRGRSGRCCRSTQARANRLRLDWSPDAAGAVVHRRAQGRRRPLAELVPFIDWTFFFAAWELKGRFPAILDASAVRRRRRASCTTTRRRCSTRIVDGKLIRARGVYGFWPASSDGDDIVLLRPTDERADGPTRDGCAFPMLRQQEVIADDKPNRSLADFVAPVESGVTRLRRRLRRHRRPRRRRARRRSSRPRTTTTPRSSSRRWPIAWPRRSPSTCTRGPRATGATADERCRDDDLIDEKYPRHPARRSATRPAPITPRRRGCSTCSARARSGMDLTESFAMTPAASVSGLYFSHPQAQLLRTSSASGAIRSRTTRAQGHGSTERGRALAAAGARLRAGHRSGHDRRANAFRSMR